MKFILLCGLKRMVKIYSKQSYSLCIPFRVILSDFSILTGNLIIGLELGDKFRGVKSQGFSLFEKMKHKSQAEEVNLI